MSTLERLSTAKILVVDDEEPIRTALEKFLSRKSHTALTAEGGEEALEIIRKEGDVDLMLLDVRMPGVSGIEVLPRALEIDPSLGIVMLSGITDATTAAICMQRGALDYLTKPIELTDLQVSLTKALRRRDTIMQTEQIQDWLKLEVDGLTKEVDKARERFHWVTVATLQALVNALEAKDKYFVGHSARIAALSATIAHELSLGDDEIERIRTAARLHDLGMIGVRESVLWKEGPLTPEEQAHVREHVVVGSQILAPLSHLGQIISFVRNHHERWDGQGYPDHLKGDDIPMGARVIGAAEIFDALTTARSYRTEMSQAKALQRMSSLSGSAVDPNVVKALNTAVANRKTLTFIEGY